ncbi:MAG: TetR/AcrR family transcriptional regulator [Acidimicrobiales bacterium]|jgi:TetR/AcrR family transcriptional repressor of nem operon
MAGSRQTVPSGTASEILDIAERFVQSRGFNGFSYADVSSELGITKAALHYHFPGKAELGQSLVSRYTDRFIAALGAIDAKGMPAPDKLLAYCDLYRATLRGQRMCLCGMLAAEYDTLGEPMRDAIVTFFEHNQTWLAALLETGREAGALHFAGPAEQAARTVVAALEGAMLVARPYRDATVLDAVIDRLLVGFVPTRTLCT